MESIVTIYREFSYSISQRMRCPVLKKLSKFNFHECLRPNGLDASSTYRAFQNSRLFQEEEEGEEKLPPLVELDKSNTE